MGAIQQAMAAVGAAIAATNVTFDPARKGLNMTLSAGNRTATNSSGGAAWSSAMCLNGKSTGKWYVEFTPAFNPINAFAIGIGNASMGLADIIGRDVNGWGYYTNGSIFNNAGFTAYGPSFSTGDVLGIALDIGGGKVWFSKNGSFTGNPAAGTGAAVSGLTGTLYCGVSASAGGDSASANSSVYSPPSGFSQWT